jgi:hypothetical protein
MRRTLSLLTVLLALPAIGGRAAADGRDQAAAVDQVIEEAIHRDRTFSSPVQRRAFLSRQPPSEHQPPRWRDRKLKVTAWPPAGEVAEEAFARAPRFHGFVTNEQTSYPESSWQNLTLGQRAAFEAAPAQTFEVAANLPVGTEIAPQLPSERLDAFRTIIMAVAVDNYARQPRATAPPPDPSSWLHLNANPPLPTLKVTRTDASIPEGRANLHIESIEDRARGGGSYFRRDIKRRSARIPIRAAR